MDGITKTHVLIFESFDGPTKLVTFVAPDGNEKVLVKIEDLTLPPTQLSAKTLTVNTNTKSLNVQKNLNRASDALSTSMQRLSSGLKINSAKDDAAGLQISNRTLGNSK